MGDRSTLSESDWQDEDLLTQEEAGTRLREEIAREDAVIRAVGDNESSAAVERARTRLAAMRSRLKRIEEALATGVGTIRPIEKRT